MTTIHTRTALALVEGAAGLLRRAAHGPERRGDVPKHERSGVVLEPEARRPHAPDAALELPERRGARGLRIVKLRADALQFLQGARGAVRGGSRNKAAEECRAEIS